MEIKDEIVEIIERPIIIQSYQSQATNEEYTVENEDNYHHELPSDNYDYENNDEEDVSNSDSNYESAPKRRKVAKKTDEIGNPIYQIQQVKRDIKKLERKIDDYHRSLNNKLDMILHLLQGPKEKNTNLSMSLQQQPSLDDFSPSPIDSLAKFNQVEKKLIQYDRNPSQDPEFTKRRSKMVFYYSHKLKNVNTRTDPKNGLMHSLMRLYFEEEFLKTIGWTSASGRWAFKDSVGHFTLFKDIVNENSPRTYANCDEAGTAIFVFLRRFHEKLKKLETKNV